jgi:hypothetical protein
MTQEPCIKESINFKEYELYITQALESCKEFVRARVTLAAIENDFPNMIACFHKGLRLSGLGERKNTIHNRFYRRADMRPKLGGDSGGQAGLFI